LPFRNYFIQALALHDDEVQRCKGVAKDIVRDKERQQVDGKQDKVADAAKTYLNILSEKLGEVL